MFTHLPIFTMIFGTAIIAVFIPAVARGDVSDFIEKQFKAFVRGFKTGLARNAQLGGYVHDTNMAQYLPPNTFHCVTGTWTDIAGQVAGTICRHKAAAAETATINIPIQIPSNAVALKGMLLKYVEVDYEIQVANLTSWTMSLVKVARGTDTNVAVVSAPAGAQLLLPATTAASVEQHRDRFTLTTPAYIADGEYYFLKIVAVAPATSTIDLLSAVAYFTERL
jgi:hypothetical protein